MLLEDDTGGGRRHAVAGRVPVCWSSDCSWTPLYILKDVAYNMHIQFRLAQNWICAGTSGK